MRCRARRERIALITAVRYRKRISHCPVCFHTRRISARCGHTLTPSSSSPSSGAGLIRASIREQLLSVGRVRSHVCAKYRFPAVQDACRASGGDSPKRNSGSHWPTHGDPSLTGRLRSGRFSTLSFRRTTFNPPVSALAHEKRKNPRGCFPPLNVLGPQMNFLAGTC